jgi:uncharacterized membrane protein YjgN (DUF898 family)
LITAGFYRFWLSTDIRRSLWANTSIDGDTLEYTGTAKELLLGFLFALAILVPVYRRRAHSPVKAIFSPLINLPSCALSFMERFAI